MRCPKCGYNSFDYLDSCKKCNQDLTGHKARFNIQSIMLPNMPAVAAMAEQKEEVLATASAAGSADIEFDDFGVDDAENSADDFGIDFMGDSDEGDDLAFDELFEEVPSEEDIEETLPAPEAEAADQPATAAQPTQEEAAPEVVAVDEFSFDTEDLAESSEAENIFKDDPASDFGFDNDEDPAADIFAESEEDFSIDGLEGDEKTKS